MQSQERLSQDHGELGTQNSPSELPQKGTRRPGFAHHGQGCDLKRVLLEGNAGGQTFHHSQQQENGHLSPKGASV